MTGSANQRIELTLHVFPDSVAPRTNDHATAHVRGFCQFGDANHLLIPLRKVFVPSRRNRSLRGRVRHGQGTTRDGYSVPASNYNQTSLPPRLNRHTDPWLTDPCVAHTFRAVFLK